MPCIMGRSIKDEKHPVCQSCEEQALVCSESKKSKRKKRSSLQVRPIIENGKKSLVIHCKLESPNKWTNKKYGQKIYRGIRDQWQTLLSFHAVGLWGKHKNRKRRLSIIYYVPDGRARIRDSDNQQGACKPVIDALTRCDIFFDDNDTRLDRLPLQQIVDATLDEPMVSITVSEIE